jgi:hypothetical protein
MAWLKIHLVQLLIFWTSKVLNCATWHHIKQGYCCLLQGQQLSYIVLDTFLNHAAELRVETCARQIQKMWTRGAEIVYVRYI